MQSDPNVLDSEPPKPKRTRRVHSAAFKRQVIDEIIAGTESVSVIARRHNINANLAFKWKRDFMPSDPDATPVSGLVPVRVQPAHSESDDGDSLVHRSSEMEIALGAGRTVFVRGQVHHPTLKLVLDALS